MAEVLTSEYLDVENHIQSVILESELTMVVREKLCLPPWIPIFEGASSRYGRVEKISPLSSGFCRQKGGKTQKTVRRWIFRWQNNRGLKDSHRSGQLSKITHEIANYLDEQLKEDDELSSVERQHLVSRKFAVELSPSTIRRYLRTSLQWVVVRTRFRPTISDNNKTKRVDFARMCLDTNYDFSNVIWTDESSVQLRRHSQTM